MCTEHNVPAGNRIHFNPVLDLGDSTQLLDTMKAEKDLAELANQGKVLNFTGILRYVYCKVCTQKKFEQTFVQFLFLYVFCCCPICSQLGQCQVPNVINAS